MHILLIVLLLFITKRNLVKGTILFMVSLLATSYPINIINLYTNIFSPFTYFLLTTSIALALTMKLSKREEKEFLTESYKRFSIALGMAILGLVIFSYTATQGWDNLAYIPYMQEMIDSGDLRYGEWYAGELIQQDIFGLYSKASFLRLVPSFAATVNRGLMEVFFHDFLFIKLLFTFSILSLFKKKTTMLILMTLLMFMMGRWAWDVNGGTWIFALILAFLLIEDKYIKMFIPVAGVALSTSALVPMIVMLFIYTLLKNDHIKKDLLLQAAPIALIGTLFYGSILISLLSIAFIAFIMFNEEVKKIITAFKYSDYLIAFVVVVSFSVFYLTEITFKYRDVIIGQIDQLEFYHQYGFIFIIAAVYGFRKININYKIIIILIFSPITYYTLFIATSYYSTASRYVAVLIAYGIITIGNKMDDENELILSKFKQLVFGAFSIVMIFVTYPRLHEYSTSNNNFKQYRHLVSEMNTVMKPGDNLLLVDNFDYTRFAITDFNVLNARDRHYENGNLYKNLIDDFMAGEKCDQIVNVLKEKDIKYIFGKSEKISDKCLPFFNNIDTGYWKRLYILK